MQSPINRVPGGLLSMLDSKTQGQNPPLLDDHITPIIDVTFNFLTTIGLSQTAGSTLGSNTAGSKATITIPDGEIWVVTAFASIGDGTALGDVSKEFLYVKKDAAAAIHPLTFTLLQVVQPIGQQNTCVFQPPQPMFLQAGAELGVRVDLVTVTGTWDYFTTVLYYKLNV